MDISETYIKMCEKSEEIQLLRREERHNSKGKWKDGDIYTHIDGEIGMAHPSYLDAWASEPDYLHHPHENIWLPRQDQLQEMVLDNDLSMLIERFYCWNRDTGLIFLSDKSSISMEQLWLAFVMQEKWGKIWDGENWIQ